MRNLLSAGRDMNLAFSHEKHSREANPFLRTPDDKDLETSEICSPLVA
jgi:hypothetical protein